MTPEEAARRTVDAVVAAYQGAADPDRAAAMSRYLRGVAPCFGIPAPERRELDRAVRASLPPPADEATVTATARACWAVPEREVQYFGQEHLRRHRRLLGPASLPVLRELVVTRSWWDTVDALAVHGVGDLARRFPQLRVEVRSWIDADDRWLVRTALLHQLDWKGDTDPEVLFALCLRRAGDRDFFVRKAIGWALRQYARTDPDAVHAFVSAHRDELSSLSVREATRRLGVT